MTANQIREFCYSYDGKGCGKSTALTMYVFTNFIVLLLFYFGSVSEYFTV